MGDLIFAVRGSSGFSLKYGVEDPENLVQKTLDPKDAYCRCIAFSNDGAYFAYCDSTRTVLVESSTGRECFSAELSKTISIFFSPADHYMVTYEPYVIYGTRQKPDGTVKTPNPNLRFWEVPSGRLLATQIADKQVAWKPQFTADDSIALRVHGSEVHFYKNGNFEKYTNKAVVKDINFLTVSPGLNPHACCFVPSKGNPTHIQLRALNDSLELIYTKTSFNCDRCAMNWNSKGNALLITASVEVDKTNQSYYGVSHIYCISIRGCGDCYQVPLSKQGPVHSVQWAPNAREFCVCYGFMPSKVTIFNIKGDIVWDLGEGHRNEVHYNPQSNILATCGFGNIASGKMEFWDLAEQKEISQFSVPHTTHFEWAPDGKHLCTSTTAPRLRTDNGYRIWTYGGKKVHEKLCEKEELWEVKWRPCNVYAKFAIEEPTKEQKLANATAAKKNNVQSPVGNLPKGAVTAQGRYVPPHLRKNNVAKSGGGGGATSPDKPKGDEPTDDEKRIKNLKKKLEDIERLKKREAEGEKLELNQFQKVGNEPGLRKELQELMKRIGN